MTGGSAASQVGADLRRRRGGGGSRRQRRAGADVAATAPIVALFLAESLICVLSRITEEGRVAFAAGLELEVRPRGSSPCVGEPTAGAGCARGMACGWSALLHALRFLLFPRGRLHMQILQTTGVGLTHHCYLTPLLFVFLCSFYSQTNFVR
jgi:hypothetical protein